MSDLRIDTDLVRNLLIEFIKTKTSQSGYPKAVVNLSGGIDSAVVCALAALALGPANVFAIRLPYKTSSSSSLEHAQMLIDLLKVNSLTIPISAMVDPLINLFPDMSAIRKGNIMARSRMIIAYDQSQDFHGLVLGTGNKTEWLLGYTTLYGDSACAFNPVGDLYKTQLRQLARALNIPQEIIDKPPSADLWKDQTDEGELGFTYADVDQLLYLLVEQNYHPQDCIKAGFQEPFVRKVITRIKNTQFKRILPPIISITGKKTDLELLNFWKWSD